METKDFYMRTCNYCKFFRPQGFDGNGRCGYLQFIKSYLPAHQTFTHFKCSNNHFQPKQKQPEL